MVTNVLTCPHCEWTGGKSTFEASGDGRTCPVCDHTIERS